jgi:hypothetical protein
MAVGGPVLADRRPSARSRVTNGKEILPGIDWRSPTARRYRDLVAQIAADQGGADRMSESRLQLIRRFAASACMAESMEADLANGKTIDVAQHALLCSTLVRLAQRIGIDRTAREIVPTLHQYIAANHAEPTP